jgi:hypothetical protein
MIERISYVLEFESSWFRWRRRNRSILLTLSPLQTTARSKSSRLGQGNLRYVARPHGRAAGDRLASPWTARTFIPAWFDSPQRQSRPWGARLRALLPHGGVKTVQVVGGNRSFGQKRHRATGHVRRDRRHALPQPG